MRKRQRHHSHALASPASQCYLYCLSHVDVMELLQVMEVPFIHSGQDICVKFVSVADDVLKTVDTLCCLLQTQPCTLRSFFKF